MGGQTTPSGNSRMCWTPTMERYFIDLMLEHMHRGNRVGHTFNKQAWIDMLAVFNAKFGSNYDKDVLKSRYTNLWKQFNEIKNLLGQSGFSWDETRQMVVADDYVWDAYIQAHPDARSYKTKAVMNFSDLCLIYGYTTADGRYSRSSHDIDADDEVQGSNMGDGIGRLVSSNGDRSRTDWSLAMDQYFIELMLNQQEKGNKLDNGFNKEAWNDMLTLFNSKFGPNHRKRVLRHRYKKLLKYYTDVRNLLKQDGFSWDEGQQMVAAANDDVWDNYIKKHPTARSYRTKVLPDYKQLESIFGDAFEIENGSDLHQDKELEDESIGVKTGIERSRTYWTPPMDRYLVELLLEQVHKGNRIGKTFITQAWIDMVRSFNANFNSQHDKDVLKNRYKHLRRQYNDVNVLLEQKGFSWDESREMVTAEDHIWDAYSKAHPDAKSYRVKTVPSFNKLCVIFGQDGSVGKYSHLAQNVGPESEVSLQMMGDQKDEEWTPSMDRNFLDLMLEQVHKGHKIDQTFDVQAWAHMIASFNEKFGIQFDKYVLEDRYAYFMKQYNDINCLLNQSGFSWDETRQTVAADDDVWDTYIKEHPDANSYRGSSLGHYNDLCLIFGTGITDKYLSCHDPGTEFDQVCEDLQIQIPDIETSDDRKRRSAMTPSPSGRLSKAPKPSEEKGVVLSDMCSAVTKFVDKKKTKNYTTIEGAIDALQAIDDIDVELMLDACDLLEDDRKAKTFLALDVSLRKKWLHRKLGRH